MSYSKFLPIVFLFVVVGLNAQTPGSLQGKWSGTTKSQSGGELALELVIGEANGTWRYLPKGTQGRNNPCLGKEYPVSVISQSSTELSIEIKGSSVMQGCLDLSATLKSGDGKLLEGALSDGRPISLTR